MDKPDKVIPANLEAEEAVLGSLLIDPDAIIRVAASLKPDDFYRERNSWIYQAILDLHERREPADFVTLVDELERRNQLQEIGGAAYITALINGVPTAIHVEHYARIVERTATLRRLIAAASQIAAFAYQEAEDVNEVVDRAEQLIFAVSERRVRRDLTSIRQIMGNVVDRIDYLHRHRGDVLGVPSGFTKLDKLLGGFQKSDLVVLAARPGVGKCIVSGSRLLDPATGQLVTIDEIVRQRHGRLLTLNGRHRLQPAEPSDFVDDGVKPVYRVRTALGREITTTASHPFLTIDGWQPLEKLAAGERVAVPRELPYFGTTELPEAHIKLLAYLLADGCLTATVPQFTNENDRIRADYAEAVASIPGMTTRLYTSGGTRTATLHAVGDPLYIKAGRARFADRLNAALSTYPAPMRHLAQELDVNPSLICAWKKADCVPNPQTLDRLCDLLAVEPDSLAEDGLAAISRNSQNPLVLWLQEMGVWGKNAHQKSVPALVFQLVRPQMALFLNRLFACDGSVHLSNGENPQVSYATVSLRLARDVQHLLLRFGVIAKLRHRQVRYCDELRPAYELCVLGSQNVAAFLDHIGVFGKEQKVQEARAACANRCSNANLDTIPMGVWPRILEAKGEQSWRSVYDKLGYPPGSNFHVGIRAPGRDRVRQLGRALSDQTLVDLAESDLYWDTIESIEYAGEHQVYDLTVDETHNFVAEDMLVHNTSLALNVGVNAAKRYGQRVAFFSLEMSSEQLVQRLLSAETGINQQRLRLGDIKEDEWFMLMEAAGVLSETLFFIDDTPAASALELRTKARRLQAEHGLDMVIVDYLQLMRGDGRIDNRVQEISYITRALKGLARELEVPVLALSQLSRAVESRSDHRPILSDLRESGCLAGNTLITLADSGQRVPIRHLVGQSGFAVWALNPQTQTLERRTVSRAFSTGTKVLYRLQTRLGRTIRATANHKFLSTEGWKRLDQLRPGAHLALPAQIPAPCAQELSGAELALLGHLVGQGVVEASHSIASWARDENVARLVSSLVNEVFGQSIQVEMKAEQDAFRVTLTAPASEPDRLHVWLDRIGLDFDEGALRVPAQVFQHSAEAIAGFLRHLWAAGGRVKMRTGKKPYPLIYYKTDRISLARDVQSLLLRLGINARLAASSPDGSRNGRYHVVVNGKPDILRFVHAIGAAGKSDGPAFDEVSAFLASRLLNVHQDVLPRTIWRPQARPMLRMTQATHRELYAALNMAYGEIAVPAAGFGPEVAHPAPAMEPIDLPDGLPQCDIYWDQVVSIRRDRVEEVFDLTVPEVHNFVADDIIVHNSIEQDADVVMFIYREDMVKEDSERKNVADVIVAKHRNGPVDTVPLYFSRELTKFADLEMTRQPLDIGP